MARVKREFFTLELIQKMAKSMENHVIVVGYKFLGKYVVESLQRLKIEFIVITRTEAQLGILKSHNIPAFYTPITHIYEALKEANIEKASTLISTLENDGENMLTVLTAKKLNNRIKTISVVNDRELVEGVKDAGANTVIPYFEILGQILATSSLSMETAGAFFSDELRSKFVAEFKIETSGISFGEIKGICPILMISRSGEVISDMKDNFQLKEGDFVYALTDQECIKVFRHRLNSLAGGKTSKA
jgi:voltage-gated potassium channel Kch